MNGFERLNFKRKNCSEKKQQRSTGPFIYYLFMFNYFLLLRKKNLSVFLSILQTYNLEMS